MAFGKKTSFFGNLAQSIGDVILMRPKPDEEMIDELEEVLISADLGMDTTIKITDELRDSIRHDRLRDADAVKERIKEIVCGMLDKQERNELNPNTPLVIMMI
ncbi:MAG: signal recognition particle receptor subunit alpha, partial [Firmicutes bacterium]|nr:signal recognition particle receptor subunit alpha [Bacillota bacterium]